MAADLDQPLGVSGAAFPPPPQAPPKAEPVAGPAVDAVARIGDTPRQRFGNSVEAGSNGTPKKKGQPHAELAGTGPELCGREEAR